MIGKRRDFCPDSGCLRPEEERRGAKGQRSGVWEGGGGERSGEGKSQGYTDERRRGEEKEDAKLSDP